MFKLDLFIFFSKNIKFGRVRYVVKIYFTRGRYAKNTGI